MQNVSAKGPREKWQWSQNNPLDQYTAILGALEGNISNAHEGINVKGACRRSFILIEQLQDLKSYLEKNPREWTD